MNDTFLDNVDINKFHALIEKTENNIKYFQSVRDDIVKKYSGNLDDLMRWIYVSIIQPEIPADCDLLEKAFLELSNCVYFTYENLEHVGTFDTLSKASYKEVYNNAYTSNIEKDGEKRNKKTVAELTAIAESESQYESVLNDIYSSAYLIIRNKITAAQTMIATLSKIISRRMQENSTGITSSKQRLLEDY